MEEIISIIVPVYNAEKTLECCVRSLTGQSDPGIEIILVNDGSRDNSLELCRRLAEMDSRVRVVDQPNGGVSSARNAGLDAATGAFVMFCDSDDWVHPHWCRHMRQNYAPGDLTICRYQRWDGGEMPDAHLDPSLEIARRQDFLHYPMWMCALWSKIFRRSVIEENHIRFSRELSMGEDFCFVLAYLCAIPGNVRFLSAELYYYDVSLESSLSKRVPPLAQCELLFQKITAAMETLGATDAESKKNRDWLIAPHFDHLLRDTAQRTDWTFHEKIAFAQKLARNEACRECRFESMPWRSSFYLFLLRGHHFRILLVLLLVRQKLRK